MSIKKFMIAALAVSALQVMHAAEPGQTPLPVTLEASVSAGRSAPIPIGQVSEFSEGQEEQPLQGVGVGEFQELQRRKRQEVEAKSGLEQSGSIEVSGTLHRVPTQQQELDELVEVSLAPAASEMAPLRDITPTIVVTPQLVDKFYTTLFNNSLFAFKPFQTEIEHKKRIKNFLSAAYSAELQNLSETDLTDLTEQLFAKFNRPIDPSWIQPRVNDLYKEYKKNKNFELVIPDETIGNVVKDLVKNSRILSKSCNQAARDLLINGIVEKRQQELADNLFQALNDPASYPNLAVPPSLTVSLQDYRQELKRKIFQHMHENLLLNKMLKSAKRFEDREIILDLVANKFTLMNEFEQKLFHEFMKDPANAELKKAETFADRLKEFLKSSTDSELQNLKQGIDATNLELIVQNISKKIEQIASPISRKPQDLAQNLLSKVELLQEKKRKAERSAAQGAMTQRQVQPFQPLQPKP